MSTKQRVNGTKRRGQTVKAHSAADLAEVARATSRLWRKHHLSYDQTKYAVERARSALGVEPPRTRRRTVQRLDCAEVERLIRSAYHDSSAYGVMIKTLFLADARVNEFVHIRVEDLHLDDESPQIYLTHAKREACRYVPVLPASAQELYTRFQGCRRGYLFESNRHTLYSVRTVQAVVERFARQAGIAKRVYPHLLPAIYPFRTMSGTGTPAQYFRQKRKVARDIVLTPSISPMQGKGGHREVYYRLPSGSFASAGRPSRVTYRAVC